MAKRRGHQKQKVGKQPISVELLQKQLQKLVEQKKYRQALDKLKQIRRADPEAKATPSEAAILSLRGQQEFAQANYLQAERTFRQTLDLGLVGEGHYWLAKCLLALEQPEDALELIETAFNGQVLPKDYAGCYLKLLFLKGDTASVEDLISHQAKRFYAPQLHWARGILALKAEQFEAAATHLKKMGRIATPGDRPTAWVTFAYQQAGDWDKAEKDLGVSRFSSQSMFSLSPTFPQHPVTQRLSMAQAVATGKSLSDAVDLDRPDTPKREAAMILEMLRLIEADNVHEAAHIAERLERPCQIFPELDALYRPLMLLAGEQALKDNDPDCAQDFWGEVVNQPSFDPQLAVNLLPILNSEGYHHESLDLLSQLQKWLKQEAKQNPSVWPDTRLHQTLAKLNCMLADDCMATGQHQKGFRALREAERLCPESPEVIGRQGLKARMEGHPQQAIPLLTKALEAGCRHEEVYIALLKCLESLGEDQTRKDIRRRFGKHFGDISVDLEIDTPAWVDALSSRKYGLFEQLALAGAGDAKDSALQACRIFVKAAEDDPNTNERVTLDQATAAKQWDKLLQPLSAKDKIPVLQAIFLSIQRFAKRKKGIAALQTQYQQQLFALAEQAPEARSAHIVLVVVKGLKPDRLKLAVDFYLQTVDQPGTALAQIQLQARRFVQTDALRPLIDEALKRGPQNPQLLLAKATTFPAGSPTYAELKEKGFELARRLQDAPALQAFREEEAFQNGLTMPMPPGFPDLFDFAGPGGLDMESLLRRLAQQFLGEDIPPEVLERMLPEFERMMAGEGPDFDLDEDFDEDDFFEFNPFNFSPPSGRRPSKSKKSSKGRRRFEI